MANSTSKHILGTAANLLGFCLFVITSLHASNKAASSIIDEITTSIAFFLSLSGLFSFISIRTQDPAREERLEKVADYLFVLSLVGIIIIILLLFLNIIH